MAVTINGNGTITGYTPTAVSGTLTASNMPSGSIIQTAIGANGEVNTSSVSIDSTDVNNPTFLNSNCKVTITPQFSNSKILLIWRAGIRLDPDAQGYFGVYYSPNSNMSSPVVLDKSHGANLNETFRNNDGSGDAHIFMPDTGVTWDSTVTNTNTRYYNVGGYESAGSLVYGDHQIALQIMAQEIKA